MITDDLAAATVDPIKSYQTNPTNRDNARQFLCYDIMDGFFCNTATSRYGLFGLARW